MKVKSMKVVRVTKTEFELEDPIDGIADDHQPSAKQLTL